MNEPLILASASPRRADLLTWAGVPFITDPASVDESRAPGESPVFHAKRLAREKALAKDHPARLVLGADTTVFIGEKIFDKPTDRYEALEHLKNLAGRTHQVVTAFCLFKDGQAIKEDSVISRVTFRELGLAEMKNYVDNGEGLDKAGAYGLQGKGWFLIESIEGSCTNVIGLPLSEVLSALSRQAR